MNVTAQARAASSLRSNSFFSADLAGADPEIARAIQLELGRQRDGIELIASENIVSRAVLEAQGSVMTNKYAEGYPARATMAAVSGSTSPRRLRSIAPRSCSALLLPTSNPIPAAR